MPQTPNHHAGRIAFSLAAVLAGALALGGCGGASLSNLSSNIFGSSPEPASDAPNSGGPSLTASDLSCPDVTVRTGAATLLIGSKPGQGEPAPLDVVYQGNIVNTARECGLNAGLVMIKVGVEGRVITGPAGVPGVVNVPLRVAVVHEGISPTTIVSKFTIIPVTISNAVDRVNFTHIQSDITFPVPQPPSALDHYVIYVGFDPIAAQPQKKPVKPKPKAKAKQS